MVFAPIPLLSVTVDTREEMPDIRLRAEGPGCRQTRVLAAFGVSTVLCGCFGGESGPVLRQLLAEEGIECRAVRRPGRNGTRVREQGAGTMRTVAESPGDPLTPQEADRLRAAALEAGARADVCVLTQEADPAAVPPGLYRGLTGDLRARGVRVVAALSGEALAAALTGGVDVLCLDQRRLPVGPGGHAAHAGVGDLVAAMRRVRSRGAGTVVLRRAERPALVLIGEDVVAVPAPVPPGGTAAAGLCGDRLIAAIAAGLATGLPEEDAVRLGVAAGTPHSDRPEAPSGMDPETARQLAGRVELHEPALEETPGGSGAFW